MDTFQDTNLSERIRTLLRQRIVHGELPGGSRLNEVHLAEEFQVSRTPLREALSGLVSEGAVEQIPRRGFFVRPLTAEEFRHIYPIRALLDLEALRLSGIPSEERLGELHQLNEELHRETEVERRIDLDDRWHLLLVAECPNPILLQLIRDFMARTRRYELAYFREAQNLTTAAGDHQRILDALAAEDLETAGVALHQNLTGGIEPILQWLSHR